jgi:hypothetical protein
MPRVICFLYVGEIGTRWVKLMLGQLANIIDVEIKKHTWVAQRGLIYAIVI